MKLKNNYFFMRHGHSLANLKKIASCWPEKKNYPLTKQGIKEVQASLGKIKKNKIDLIFYSDLRRTEQTALIISKEIKVKTKKDKRLRECNVGIYNGKKIDEIGRFWDKEKKLSPLEYYQRRFFIAPKKGENYLEIEERMLNFIEATEKKYNKKNILIVSHERPLTLLLKAIKAHNLKKFVKSIIDKKTIKTGEFRKII